jgi:hypothetical protein
VFYRNPFSGNALENQALWACAFLKKELKQKMANPKACHFKIQV